MKRVSVGITMTLAVAMLAGCGETAPEADHSRAVDYQSTTVTLNRVNDEGTGEAIGSVHFEDSPNGLLIRPELAGLPHGIHGFHVHQNPDCGPAENDNGDTVPGLAAGGHYDPEGAGAHLGPYDDGGHLGDMPALYFDADEQATLPVLAPWLRVADLQGRALVLHAGGDNYSDDPAALGGGGARFACGVVGDQASL